MGFGRHKGLGILGKSVALNFYGINEVILGTSHECFVGVELYSF